jgi:hypothetical protein
MRDRTGSMALGGQCVSPQRGAAAEQVRNPLGTRAGEEDEDVHHGNDEAPSAIAHWRDSRVDHGGRSRAAFATRLTRLSPVHGKELRTGAGEGT